MSNTTPTPGLIENNPIAVLGGIALALGAVLNVLVQFGLDSLLTEARQDAIQAAVNPVGLLIVFYLMWRKTKANAQVVASKEKDGTIRAGDASSIPTGAPLPVASDPLTGESVALMKLNEVVQPTV